MEKSLIRPTSNSMFPGFKFVFYISLLEVLGDFNLNSLLLDSSGKKRRLTFMECNNDINTMIDLAKVADLVSLIHGQRG